MSWQQVANKAGEWLIRLCLLYWVISAVYSAVEFVRHGVMDGLGPHTWVHLVMAAIYTAAALFLLSILYPQVQCPRCQGDGNTYNPQGEWRWRECVQCRGKGTVTGKRYDR